MAATFIWGEDNGSGSGSFPQRGSSRTTGDLVDQMNWKNIDDVASNYSSYPVTAGGNSFVKYQFGIFTGSYTQISNVKWSHTSGTLGAGLTVRGCVTSVYHTPTTGADADLTGDMTSITDVSQGYNVLLHQTGPQESGTETHNGPHTFTQYLATQLRVTTAAAAGDTAVLGFTLRYDEQ